MAKKHFFRYKKANEILSTLVDNTLTRTNKVNDFTDGSILKTLYEAFSTEIEMFYFLTIENIKGGVWNSVYNAFGFARKPEMRAYGDVVVTFNYPLTSDIIIPKGVKVTSTSNYYNETYRTVDEYKVPKGSSTARITVYCTDGGSVGNIPSGVLDTASNIVSMSTITNPEAFSTGQDEESDTEVRVRFREFIQALQRGTVQALQYGAKTVPNVDGVYVSESVGRVILYAHDKNGDLSDDLQQDIQNEMPYWRSAGVPVVVLPIHKTLVDMNITVEVPDPVLNSSEFEEYVRATLVNYINNSKVHDNLVYADVIQKIMDLSDLGITDARADIMVYPDAYKRGNIDVTEYNSVYLNGRQVDRSLFYPENRSKSEDYIVSNPNDKDEETVAYFDTNTSGKQIEQDNSSTSSIIAPSELLDSLDTNNIPIEPKSFISDSTVQLGRKALKNVSASIAPVAEKFSLADSVSAYSSGDLATGLDTDDDSNSKNNQKVDGRQSDGSFIYRVEMPDGIVARIQFNKDNKVQDIVLTPKNESYQVHTVKNYTTKGLTVSIVKPDGSYSESKYIEEQSNVSFKNYEILNNSTQVAFRGTDNSTLTVNNDDGIVYYTYDKTSIKASINPSLKQKTMVVDENKGVVSSTTYTLDDKLVQSITDYTNVDGTVTTIVRDSNNNVTRIIVKAKDGTIISDSDSSTGGNVKPTATTTSTTIPTTTTTTTTTTQYPFSHPKSVSASDAPDTGYLPVFGKYLTGVDEIIRAENINVTFTDSLVNTDDSQVTLDIPTTTTTISTTTGKEV